MQTPDMTSMAERLRARSAKKPLYNDEDDDFVEPVSERSSGSASKKGTKIARDDAKDDLCQTCGEDGRLFQCSTCTYAYHLKCLYPPLKIEPEGSWSCSNCVHPLNEIEKILHYEMKPISNDSEVAEGSKGKLVKHYLVKWKRLSYLHCSWIPESDFLKAFKGNPRIRTKLNNFLKQMESMNGSEEDIVPIRPEWTTVDRIIASRKTNGKRQYLVKWKELPYDECYWEAESDISAFEDQIQRFIKFQSRKRKPVSGKSKNSGRDAKDGKEKQSAFKQYESSPTFLSGGSLHPYQLEGLNFLRFSWAKQAHVILADEMGLGKTIQSIAYLASLFEESIAPHLVVAPLSTLRNWEREFATWAPHMNVILYVGSSQARAIIQQHEFHYSKIQDKKLKKKKKTKGFFKKEKGKKDPIKFDVLLTSYEMINIDAMTLKQIKWECMIVDEGHRLKNKDSKLFNSLKIFSSNHRVLLTGTPLQNNLDELFMLMHFLDAGKFSSLSEFQEEFKDINQEEQVSRLHKMLAPHLLRRVKKDVMKDLPPKKELILRVELSSLQKDYYKAILTRNYKLLTRKGGPQISLNNIMMELRKLCCHAYMLGVEPEAEDKTEAFRKLLESSGKLLLLDKMMVRLREQGHRVLIYSQFRHMLDLLEDYLCFKNWSYERIDGMISGTDRQIRIDRFNAKNSTRFCFLLSTRAGGLGINLATADTVIIYDSDWNPHADLQAMARAHRLGQTNKVMIFRLISRGTIEERMMQLTKKKMVLEHLVVGRLKNQGLNQEELDDIIRYGSKELFADEADETGKSRQIHYDDAAIDRLLDRDQVTNEEPATNDEEDDGFLEAFKVANFEYVDEAEVAEALEEAKRGLGKEKSNGSSSDRAGYWEELLKDKYDVQQIEEFTALGKGKRSRKQMTLQEDDDLAGLEDVGSDPEEDTEADWMDAETMPGNVVRRVHRKKLRVDAKDFVPLMEGEEKSLKVLGFNRVHRAAFVQTMLRFGTWDDDWSEYVYRIKNKSLDEIKAYALLFLEHLAEDITESPYFSDGVPKEELRIQDVLVRIAVLNLIRDKVTVSAETPGISIFPEDLMLRYPGLRSGKVWKKEQDVVLFQAILKHGYGRWQAIIEDKDLGLHKIICQELNLPCTYGNTDTNVPGQESLKLQSTDVKFENEKNDTKSTLNGSSSAAEASGEAAQEIAKGSQRQDGSYVLSDAYPIQFRETQRRVIEFVKKRMVLLEKAITQEYAVDFFAYQPLESTAEPEHKVENSESNIKSTPSSSSFGEHLPSQGLYPILEPIAPTEVLSNSSQYQPDLYYLPRLYNQMCKTLVDIEDEAVQAHMGDKHAASKMRKGLRVLDANAELVLRMLSAPNMLEAHKIALGLDCDKTPQQDDVNGVKSTCTSSSGPGEIASVATTTTSSQSEMAPSLHKDPLEDSRGLGVI